MRTPRASIALSLLLASSPLLLHAPAALAACGDGVKQAGEACDASASGGDASCPGACVPAGLVGACTCATPSTDFRTYAVIAGNQLKLSGGANVVGGDAAVSGIGGFLVVGKGASLPATQQATADRSKLSTDANVGRLLSNEVQQSPTASINNGGPLAFNPPILFPTLPSFPTVTPGSDDIVVPAGDTQELAPGFYGKLVVGQGARLILRGLSGGSGVGRYEVTAVKVAFEGRIHADNPVVLNVRDRFALAGSAFAGPTPGEPMLPKDLHINVAQGAAKVGRGATLLALLRASLGKVGVGSGGQVQGLVIGGGKVSISKQAVVARSGGCGDGVRSLGEQCDLSAPNGDSACPGDCIPGDASGLNRIEQGQPGQCHCRCDSNADCDNHDACDGIERCQAGICVKGTLPDCDDDNECTVDCKPSVGCVREPVEDNTSCSDGDACTRNDKCQNGQCVSGEPRDCADNNSCTTDTCEQATGCKHAAVQDATSCQDGNACTTQDACIRGACVGGPAPDCEDTNPCTVGSCDRTLGCVQTKLANNTSCAGPSPCTAADFCLDGTCTSGAGTLCNDSNPCTADVCTVTGPVNMPVATCDHTQLPNFTPCGPNGQVCFFGVCQ